MWTPSGAPTGASDFYCYDPGRDRTVLFNSGGTYEYDGVSWVFVSGTRPNPGYPFSGVAYDRVRHRIVCYDSLETWQWDGSVWTHSGWPPIWSFRHLVAHEGRGTVIAFGGTQLASNDLYEWDGVTWNLIPTTNPPPRMLTSTSMTDYLSAAYDPRRDKLVLFGTATFDWNTFQWSNLQPDVWEWDATNGWVNRTVAGGLVYRTALLFFDSQRGVLTSMTAGNVPLYLPLHIAEWDGGSSWQPVTPAVQVPTTYMISSPAAAYDSVRGYAFVTFIDASGVVVPYAYRNVIPARFEVLGPGCPGSLGEPVLHLTHNWTRAWLGRALSVDLANLPLSTGLVVLGFSDQTYGTLPLPASLASYGMPGCFARVTPDAVHFVSGTSDTATLTLPVPDHPALIGTTFHQQGYAFDPGANTLGMTVSNSVRVTIGRL